MTLTEAVNVFASKGPVDIATAQVKAERAWHVLRPHLYADEIDEVMMARGHALVVGEGRREFDAVMKRIRRRLGR